MTLGQFQDLKLWHQRHWREQPLEKHAWDAVVTFWLAGWVGAPTALIVHAAWAVVICAALFALPGVYVSTRRRLHVAGRVRCDWLGVLG